MVSVDAFEEIVSLDRKYNNTADIHQIDLHLLQQT